MRGQPGALMIENGDSKVAMRQNEESDATRPAWAAVARLPATMSCAAWPGAGAAEACLYGDGGRLAGGFEDAVDALGLRDGDGWDGWGRCERKHRLRLLDTQIEGTAKLQ